MPEHISTHGTFTVVFFYLNDAEKRNTRLIDYKIKGTSFLSAWEYYELVRYRTESDF